MLTAMQRDALLKCIQGIFPKENLYYEHNVQGKVVITFGIKMFESELKNPELPKWWYGHFVYYKD